MRAVAQRVRRARVTVEGRVVGEIAAGLMVLLGVGRNDTSAVAANMAEKIANLRIFEDDQGKMNRFLVDVHGSTLVVSQFTLYGEALRKLGITVATGIFGAMMSVELVNEGPVTILLDSDKAF
jgi:D-tyrosyl-tRNA(Tyr) deacylase